MSTLPDRRSRKRLATRQAISDAATLLFMEHGFDAVTVDEIAAAADVGRMTVFNHFPRKEDLFFDRDEEAREAVRAALRERDPGTTPLDALCRLAHRVVAQERPYIRFFPGSLRFIQTVEGSDALKARARAIRDEAVQLVAAELAQSAGQVAGDPLAHLLSGLLVAGWSVALIESHRAYRQTGDAEAAKRLFLTLTDKAAAGLRAGMAATPYA